MNRGRPMPVRGMVRLVHGLAVILILAFVSIQTSAEASTAALSTRVALAACQRDHHDVARSASPSQHQLQSSVTRTLYEVGASEFEADDDSGLTDTVTVQGLPSKVRLCEPESVYPPGEAATCSVVALACSGLPRGPPATS